MTAAAASPTGARGPSVADRVKIAALAWMRQRNYETVNQGSVAGFRRRRVPTAVLPRLERACEKYDNMSWAPKELMVPAAIPREARLPPGYKLRYYGLARSGFRAYHHLPMRPDVQWAPSFRWNRVFPPTGDGWEHPTADGTFARLRLQGPNPWLLRRVEDGDGAGTRPGPSFELDLSAVFDGILPPVIARFAVDDGVLVPTDITVGGGTHRPGDPTWAQAKRVVNAADARYVVFGRHLLHTHLIVGEAFALAAFSLPVWHRLRPFMQFFTYGTLSVNDIAYQSLVTEGGYFIESGFATVEDARRLFENLVAEFDLDRWLAPWDIDERGIAAVPDHPYVHDARMVWPVFAGVVARHLDDLGLDDATIAADPDLSIWYLTLTKLIPNCDPHDRPLDRTRLAELCTILLWNNVVHEICGDFSPLAGSEDPLDKAVVNLEKLKRAVADGDLTVPVEPPTMADVFLVDQASFVSRFNVGGNNILAINAARMVDDPKLRVAIEDLQRTLRRLEEELVETNAARPVRFARMFPRHWEASISF